jgi:hypothetical protein
MEWNYYYYYYCWLRRCCTSWTVLGSIPGGVTGFFSDMFPSNRTMALGSTQPLVKMSTRNISGGKGGRCVRLTTSPPLRTKCQENLGAWTSWATLGLLRDSFTFYYYYCCCYCCYKQGKVHLITGHEGPKAELRYSSTLSLISVLDGSGWSLQHPGHFIPQNETWYLLHRRLSGPWGW